MTDSCKNRGDSAQPALRRTAAVAVTTALLTSVVALVAWVTFRDQTVFPSETWAFAPPEEVGLDALSLQAFVDFVGGRGCVVRHGYMVHTWGEQSHSRQVASASKPLYTYLLFKAVEDGRLPSVDTLVADYVPCLNELNANLDYKDRYITFRHLATQTSCYGVGEPPGEAFNYNDWQMTLFLDALLKVYGATYSNMDQIVLHPLTEMLECEDNPTLVDRHNPWLWPGLLRISVRDFARFGLLYLNKGNWNGTQLIDESHAALVVSDPLPLSLPRTTAIEAEMCPDQSSFGSCDVPDDQMDHDGSFSWSWWINGITRDGERMFPSAPLDTYVASGNDGKYKLWIFPSLDMVVSMAHTSIRGNTDEAMDILLAAVPRPTPQGGLRPQPK